MQPTNSRTPKNVGISLVVQWLRVCISISGDMGTKIPHAACSTEHPSKML